MRRCAKSITNWLLTHARGFKFLIDYRVELVRATSAVAASADWCRPSAVVECAEMPTRKTRASRCVLSLSQNRLHPRRRRRRRLLSLCLCTTRRVAHIHPFKLGGRTVPEREHRAHECGGGWRTPRAPRALTNTMCIQTLDVFWIDDPVTYVAPRIESS